MGANPIGKKEAEAKARQTLERWLQGMHQGGHTATKKEMGEVYQSALRHYTKNPHVPFTAAISAARSRHQARVGIYDTLSVKERLAFGRLGLGKAQIQTGSDLARARKMVAETQRLKNRLPNPGAGVLDSAAAENARVLYGQFHEKESERYTVRHEPHMPAGDYTDLGKLIALRVKPTSTGQTAHVQEISFPHKNIRVVCDPDGRQIWFVGDGQQQDADDIKIFTAENTPRPYLGLCRSIVYEATKWHPQLAESARGAKIEWEHEFGEEGGTCPALSYDTRHERLVLGKASYHVEGAGIVN
jgi:hypothetical protein